jgi:hypothetical protein
MRNPAQQRVRQAENEIRVVLVLHFPSHGGVCGNNVDVSMDSRSTVLFPSPPAAQLGGRTHVDCDKHLL